MTSKTHNPTATRTEFLEEIQALLKQHFEMPTWLRSKQVGGRNNPNYLLNLAEGVAKSRGYALIVDTVNRRFHLQRIQPTPTPS